MALQPGRRNVRAVVIAALLVVLLVGAGAIRFYTDILWFQEVGLASVLWKSLFTQFSVGASVGLIVAAAVWLNLLLAARIAPAYRVPRLEVIGREDPLDRYRESLGPYLKWLRLAAALVIGLFVGLAASSQWQTVLLWANRVSFGIKDQQFNKDVGFYVFELPFMTQALSWMWTAIFLSLLAAVAGHYFYGSIRPERGWRGLTSGALAHVSVLLGLLALVKAGQYWLGTYQLNFSPRGTVTGASYTDVNAQLPALWVLAIISVVSAVLFIANIRVRKLSLPLAAVGIWILFSIVVGGVWPWWVQRFGVDPQEVQKEGKFIARNIEATRAAFGLSDVKTVPFDVTTDLNSEQVRNNSALLSNVRLWDPAILQRAYEQLQTIRTYYRFEDVDIDRYTIDGEKRQVLLSPRELSLGDLAENTATWANLHLQYTHGYGLVASLANETTAGGQPNFLVKDVPGTVSPAAEEALQVDQPYGALYYGEAFEPDQYSLVNTMQRELDYPTSGQPQRSRYEGAGGIQISNLARRLAFAIRERDPNLMLSSLITEDSRILIYRDVRERVRRAAPFLFLDHDPYLAVIDGRLQWILDGYTSTRYYPYSQRFDAGDILAEANTGVLSGEINYVRNSVKVVIDAYDGTMDFFIVDEDDPLIETWSKAFPDLFSDEEPSDALREHFRYPEDLFNLQSDVYLTYHVTDPQNFYAREDQWAVPTDPRASSTAVVGTTEGSTDLTADGVIGGATGTRIPPTYLLVQLPEEEEQEFVLTRPFSPNRRPNMIAFMAAKSDPQDYGELLTLKFPPDITVLGPTQVDNLLNQDTEIAPTLTLLDQEGSRVEFGSLVILPIEDSILYVQPLFVTASNVGIPELKKVVIVSGEEAVIGDSFEEALGQLFGLEPETPEGPGGPPPPSDGGGEQGELAQVIERAGRLYDQAQEALAAGDFERYGRLIERLGKVLD
ncbi:MAG: UPF0182 family protein, partial [Actinomycetota bacterium]